MTTLIKLADCKHFTSTFKSEHENNIPHKPHSHAKPADHTAPPLLEANGAGAGLPVTSSGSNDIIIALVTISISSRDGWPEGQIDHGTEKVDSPGIARRRDTAAGHRSVWRG